MKQVKITIEGTMLMCEYASFAGVLMNEEYDFDSTYYSTNGWEKLEALYVNDDRSENLIKKKGKYIKAYDYFHDLFSEEGDHPLPVEVHLSDSPDGGGEIIGLDYIIELEDDEEFDIKKVQLIKSDYEIECCPYFILAEKIKYNGKDVGLTEESSNIYCDLEVGRDYSDYKINGFCNRQIDNNLEES